MDTRTLERKLNTAKAKVEEKRGPAGHSQQDTPILAAIRHFHDEDTVSLAIPAHKSGAGAPPYAIEALGEQAFRADQTSLNGLDNRHESWEVQTAAQNLAAEAWGAMSACSLRTAARRAFTRRSVPSSARARRSRCRATATSR
jgi:Orn/Lys/Arg decarboxylase, major domain